MSPNSTSSPRLGRKHRVLLRLERFSRQHYPVVFLLALVALLGGAWLGTRLSLDSDILGLIPPGNPKVDRFKEAVADFGALSHLIVLLESGPDEVEEPAYALMDFADVFARRLEDETRLIERVEYRLRADAEYVDELRDNAMLYLRPEQLPELASRLTEESIDAQVSLNKLLLTSPTGDARYEQIVNDPLDLGPLFLERIEGSLSSLRVDLSDNYYLSEERQSLAMLVSPTGSWQDLDFDRRLMDTVRIVEAAAREELGEDASPVSVRYSGRYAIAVDEARLIRDDIRFNLVFSLLAVSALYWFCYRRFAALLYSSVPLIVGQAMTFALAFFVLRGLNASSSAFTALLMGLGTDFVIVMYARYVEERRAGRSLAEATERMVGETGLGVFTGAITSAGTFYAMCISEFRGLRDLGFLIGSGILLCAIAIVFLVPAMIKWNEGARRRKTESLGKLHVQSFLLEHLITVSVRHRRSVLVLLLLGVTGSLWLATQLEFDDTSEVLRSENSPAFRTQRELAKKFGVSMSYMMVLVEGTDEEEALRLTELVEDRLKPFLDDGTVSSYDSILRYIPRVADQQAILAAKRNDVDQAFDGRRVRSSLEAALKRHGFPREPFEPFLDRIGRSLSPRRLLTLDDYHAVGRFAARDDERVRIVTYLSMDERFKREEPAGMSEALSAGDDRIVLTGTNVVSGEFRRIFTREAPRTVLLGLGVVFVLLLIDFRSFRLTGIALCQLICGVILMLGAMRLFGIRLNYVNAFVATMILGVGIDYSIHLVHRMSLNGGRVDDGLLETGKAVVIAALTNIAAFGTLTLGNYPALRSFGQVALIGSLSCLLTSLTLVPAMMARRGGGR